MTTPQHDVRPILEWDCGTAYDFFISYAVLSNPKRFGVRSSWASGMRARLAPKDRNVMDTAVSVLGVPAPWVHEMKAPKNAEQSLNALSNIPAKERLVALTPVPCKEGQIEERQFLLAIAARGAWSAADVEQLAEVRSKRGAKHKFPKREDLERILETWAQAEQFGEDYLVGLRAYYDVFFAEEEKRIASKLEMALRAAMEKADAMRTLDFLEEITQGIRYEDASNMERLTLVPSYWINPLVQTHTLGAGHRLLAFGARPANDSLVPGDPVPDALRNSLKALADPTRLRILRYLHHDPMTMAELTKRLRLRMPTVIHHLSALRLAGLVSIHIEGKGKGPGQRYGVRTEGLDASIQSLQAFIRGDRSEREDERAKEDT